MTIEVTATDDGNLLLTREKCTSTLLFDPNEGKTALLQISTKCASTSTIGECLAVAGILNEGETTAIFVVTKWTLVGKHPWNKSDIYRIDGVKCLFDASSIESIARKHHIDEPSDSTESPSTSDKKFGQSSVAMFKTIKSNVAKGLAAARTPNSSSADLKSVARSQQASDQRQTLVDIAKFIVDDQGFYMCPELDLTKTLARLQARTADEDGLVLPTTRKSPLHSSFAWNAHMWSALENNADATEENCAEATEKSVWCAPMLRGHVAQREFELQIDESLSMPVTITLISRRSRLRAGLRYIKRGIDSSSNVANFVETEQLIEICGHRLAFVQIRGSVPLYWSQRGLKYRPAPTVDRPTEESSPLYQEHVNRTLHTYGGRLLMLNLIDQVGRERPLVEEFINVVLRADDPNTTFVAFDYHARCSQLGARAIGALIDAVHERITDEQKFTWLDKDGQTVSTQTGVTRTNCVDCLDRTNVVQTAVAHNNLQYMLYRVGVMAPSLTTKTEPSLPKDLTRALAHIWADNGDACSIQYAGTAALKGDVTRHGQRQLKGLMKDSVNSASRYVKCHVGDGQRQTIIDKMLGVGEEVKEEKPASEHEELRALVSSWQSEIMNADEMLVGSYALIDCERAMDAEDMNTVVLLTRRAYYVAVYDDEEDAFMSTTRIPLDDVIRLQFGPVSTPSRFKAFIKNAKPGAKTATQDMMALRVVYKHASDPTAAPGAYFHEWRPARTRLFNNMALPLAGLDDANEYARAIGELFHVALHMDQLLADDVNAEGQPPLDRIPMEIVGKLDRERSKKAPVVEQVGAVEKSPRGENKIYAFLRQTMEKSSPAPTIQIETPNFTSYVDVPETDQPGTEPIPNITISHSISKEAGLLFANVTGGEPTTNSTHKRAKSEPNICESRRDEQREQFVSKIAMLKNTTELKSTSSFSLIKGRQFLSSIGSRLKSTPIKERSIPPKNSLTVTNFDDYTELIENSMSCVILL